MATNFGVKTDITPDSIAAKSKSVIAVKPSLAGASSQPGSLVYDPTNETIYFGNGTALQPIGSSISGISDSDGDTSITVEQPPNTDTDTTVFTNAGSESARITPTGQLGIGVIPAPGNKTEVSLTTSAIGTNIGIHATAEQTTSDPAGQIRAVRGDATHSGSGTQNLVYASTGHATLESGTTNFALGGDHRVIVNGTANASNAQGGFNAVDNNGTGTVGFCFGTFARVRNRDVGTITTALGTFNRVQNESTGTITTAAGTNARIDNAGTITTAIGMLIGDWTNSGTVTESRALHIEANTNTGATTSWAILSDSTADSSFAGPILLPNIKSGATQGGAGAAANELWKTAGHATLPDNVVLIGV